MRFFEYLVCVCMYLTVSFSLFSLLVFFSFLAGSRHFLYFLLLLTSIDGDWNYATDDHNKDERKCHIHEHDRTAQASGRKWNRQAGCE